MGQLSVRMSVEFCQIGFGENESKQGIGNRQGRIAVASVHQVVVYIGKSNGNLNWLCKPFLFFCIFVRITNKRTHINTYRFNL
jgi:hypothetical protein